MTIRGCMCIKGSTIWNEVRYNNGLRRTTQITVEGTGGDHRKRGRAPATADAVLGDGGTAGTGVNALRVQTIRTLHPANKLTCNPSNWPHGNNT